MYLSNRNLLSLFILLVFCGVSNTLIAQDRNQVIADTSKIYELNEIVISASRFEEPASSTGRNVTVIGRSEIENSVSSSVGDILSKQQSMHLSGNKQTQGTQQSIFLRNANSNHTIVMIDGIRISDPSSSGNSVDLSELSLAGVERIEIVRGSHSTLYGSSAIGGVINIITQGPEDKPNFDIDLDSQFGLVNGDTKSTQNTLALSGTSENGLFASLSVYQDYTNGFDATIDTTSGGFNPQDRDGFKKLDLYGKLGYRIKGLKIYGSYRRADQRFYLDQGAYADDDNAEQNFDRDLFSYGISSSLSDRLSLDFEGGYSDINRTFVNDSSVVNQQGGYDGTYTETNGDGTLWENKLLAKLKADDVQFVMGLESNHQTMNTQSYTYSSAFDYESETNLDSLGLEETINSVFAHTDFNGALLTDKMKAFSLVLGGRYAHHNRFGSHFTYEINPNVEFGNTLLYGAITSGFNAPSLYQLHSPQKGFGSFTTRGNNNLKAEESVSYEIGWKQEIGKRVRFDLSLFRRNVKNVIEYVDLWNSEKSIPNLASEDYLGDTYINIARQHVNGVELGMKAQPISSLSVSGNISYTRSESTFAPDDIDESYTGGNHVQIFESGVFVDDKKKIDGLTRRPSISANIHVDYFPADRWKIGLSSNYVGSRDDIYYSADLGPYGAQDLSNVSGYNLVDVSLQHRFSQQFSLTGKVENLFNTEYNEINGYQTRGRGLFLKASLSI